jgi:HSP20 family protein
MIYRNDYRRIMPPRRVMLRGMRNLQNAMEFLLGGTRGPVRKQYQMINAWVNEDGMLISAELPGVDPKKLDISIEGETLTLSGSRISEEVSEEVEYYRRERGYGEFTRTLNLPFRVDAESVEAAIVNGVLNLELPRLPEDKPRKISLKTG